MYVLLLNKQYKPKASYQILILWGDFTFKRDFENQNKCKYCVHNFRPALSPIPCIIKLWNHSKLHALIFISYVKSGGNNGNIYYPKLHPFVYLWFFFKCVGINQYVFHPTLVTLSWYSVYLTLFNLSPHHTMRDELWGG